MKRTPLKRKSPLKAKKTLRRSSSRKPTKKPVQRRTGAKKPTPKQLRNKLWQLCKETIRSRDGNVCFICGKQNLEGSGWQTGHFIPRSTCGALLRYDIRNLHSSCYYCNINLGGNGALFYKRLVEDYGQAFVDKIFEDKKQYTKDDNHLLIRKIEEYEAIQNLSSKELVEHTSGYSFSTP